VYICSVSFEDRSRALAEAVPCSTAKDFVILFDFEGYENVGQYLLNRRTIKRLFRDKGYPVISISSPVGSSLRALTDLNEILSRHSVNEGLLDVSTLPRKYIFGICRMLTDLSFPTTIRYYRPALYGHELSRGVGNVEAIPGFEGDMNSMGETVLGLVLGFEGYKALHAWERIGPSKLLAFIGDPPYRPEFLVFARDCNKEVMTAAGNVTELPLHTHDPYVAKAQLQFAYDQLKSEGTRQSFVLCPLGTKLQSLAAFAFALSNPAVSVAHVSSLSYFTGDYSRGHEEPLDFVLSDLVAA
jgi:hypothetical protein